MSAKRQNSDLNNLRASVHSAISGDAVNIPFADDDEVKPLNKSNGKSSDSISSNESLPERVTYNPRRRGAPVRFLSNTGTEASGESEADDHHSESEKRDKPGPLASESFQVAETSNLGVMRRNSISMPVLNEIDLDALRNLHMKAIEFSDETAESTESLTKIEVSRKNLSRVHLCDVCLFVENVYDSCLIKQKKNSLDNCLIIFRSTHMLMTTLTSFDKKFCVITFTNNQSDHQNLVFYFLKPGLNL